MAEWFRGELGEPRAGRRSGARRSASAGCSTTTQIDGLWAAHRRGRGDWSYHLWNLYNVSAWYDYWVAGRRDNL